MTKYHAYVVSQLGLVKHRAHDGRAASVGHPERAQTHRGVGEHENLPAVEGVPQWLQSVHAAAQSHLVVVTWRGDEDFRRWFIA